MDSSRKLYMRKHSNIIRKWTESTIDFMQENPVFEIDGPGRVILVVICRSHQRLLSQAWATWIKNTKVKHHYDEDVKYIVKRKIPIDELRTELEIEVLYKWVEQVKDLDPTGIASTIFLCKKKSAVYNALQQIRLEFFGPGETILFQGDIPRHEDGHFTILSGECEILQFPEESAPLSKLQYLAKKKRWDDAKRLLNSAQIVAKISKYSGFGELSTLTGVKRAATIRSTKKNDRTTEILILPKPALMDCLKSRLYEGVEGSAPSEAIDFLRQSGLANRISPKDLVSAAGSMIRRLLQQGEVLFYKGDPVNSIYLVVSGEFLLDTEEYNEEESKRPFVYANPDKCYHLTTGSILGDEGVMSKQRIFESTGVVVSSSAVVFEAVGFGMKFLTEKIGCLRYSAILYRDQLRWDPSNPLAEQMNLYTFFNSLRKSIAFMKPFRGISTQYEDEEEEIKKKTNDSTYSGLPPSRGMIKSKESDSKLQHSRLSSDRFVASPAISSRPSSSSSQLQDITTIPARSKILDSVGLHRAIDINKMAKRFLQQSVKHHAKESILYEQLRKIPQTSNSDPERDHSERLFKQSLKDYMQRSAEIARQEKEAEEEKLKAENAHRNAFNLFSQVMTSLGKDGEESQENADSTQNIEGPTAVEKEETSVKEENHKALEVPSLTISTTSHRKSRFRKRHPEIFESAPKIQQYFDWIDTLNRQGYRHLMFQAKQTAQVIEEKKHIVTDYQMTDEKWNEIAEIFNTYGLTPHDMNIPLKFNDSKNHPKTFFPEIRAHTPLTPKISLGALKNLSFSNSFEVDASKTLKPKDPNSKSSVNFSPEVIKKEETRLNSPQKSRRGGIVGNMNLSSASSDHEELVARAKVESQFKNYQSAAWREELIKKKEQEMANINIKFHRYSTPSNRRVLSLHDNVRDHEKSGKEVDDGLFTNRKDQTQSTSRPSSSSRKVKQSKKPIDYEKHIDSGEYFFKELEEADLSNQNIRKEKSNVYDWKTRFVKTTNGTAKPKPAPVDSVRTHLKEDLTYWSKSNIKKSISKMREDTITPFIKAIEGDLYKPPKITSPQAKEIEHPIDHFSPLETPLLGHQFFDDNPPDIIPDSFEEIKIRTPLQLGEDRLDLHVDTNINYENDNDSISFATNNTLTQELTLPDFQEAHTLEPEIPIVKIEDLVDKVESLASMTEVGSNLGDELNHHNIQLVRQSSTSSIPTSRPDTSLTAESSEDIEPVKKRISDLKLPSKALQQFEEFMAIKTDSTKSFNEGRKKANNNSKFRLKSMGLDDFHKLNDTYSLNDVHRQRFETEIAIFHAMNPNSTREQEIEFKRAFKLKYPDTIMPWLKLSKEDSVSLSYPSAATNISGFDPSKSTAGSKNTKGRGLRASVYTLSSASQDQDDPMTTRRSFVASPKAAIKVQEEDDDDEFLDEENDYYEQEYDPDLEKWQDYTLENIVKDKEGERRTLPAITLPHNVMKLNNLNGKKLLTRRAVRGANGSLVTLPPKATEKELLKPPSYLELYKNSFHIYIPSKEKDKILKELEVRKSKLHV